MPFAEVPFNEKNFKDVIAAMKNHPSNADVQQRGCEALGRLSDNDEIAVRVAKAGGIEAIVAAMRAMLEA